MNNFLFVIDGYLTNYQRVSACDELISQLRKFFPETKILLINKSNKSFGIDSKVDYYFYYGDGFMVGPPPQEMVDDKRYISPYVYFETSAGVLENWTPHVGVSDHVANVYNGFLMSSRIAKDLGYEKVFRIEYDMLFDEDELIEIEKHLIKFNDEDYLIYGRRKEGSWIADYLSLIDIHFCGYSNSLFEGFDLVRNNDEFWQLCEKVKYWGKWSEYLISMVFESNIKKLVGTEHSGFVRHTFVKSHFDRIASSGFWENRWTDMPKICKVSKDMGVSETDSEIVIFYWNSDSNYMICDVQTNFGYSKHIELNKDVWSYDIIPVQSNMEFTCEVNRDGIKHTFEKKINGREELSELNTRFLLK